MLLIWVAVLASCLPLLTLDVAAVARGTDFWQDMSGRWQPLVLLAVGVAGGSILFTGLPWTRWATATAFGAGAVWNALRPDAAASLPIWIGVSAVWAAAAVTLAVRWDVAAFLARQLEANYVRLLGPLQTRDDARRWLTTVDRWTEAGAVTRGVRRRIGRIMTDRLAELEPALGETETLIGELGAASAGTPLRRAWLRARGLTRLLRRASREQGAPPHH